MTCRRLGDMELSIVYAWLSNTPSFTAKLQTFSKENFNEKHDFSAKLKYTCKSFVPLLFWPINARHK